jgi:hypothetical protein
MVVRVQGDGTPPAWIRIDLCLEGPYLTHLLPWSMDLVLRHEMPAELEVHLQRVGQCLWQHQPGSRERRRIALADLKAKAEDQGSTFFELSHETLIRQDRSR